ncbi:MAG: response regulator [Gammaproteobacteria bacterium]|nr:response regulator [Gammaproteobacteria bacterium]MDP2347923.1 response regulator [Gammaproteobacteria bacterium]
MASIFIADDDQLVIDLVSFRLQRRGHHMDSATDGELALERILRNPPDLVILDYLMPIMNGPDIIAALKNDPTTAHIPILILAAQWRERDVMEALDLGVTDYMTKPFSPDELTFRVERALKTP